MSITRRDFLQTTAAGIAAASASAATPIPTRVLGRTGARVSILAMGGGSRFLQFKEEDKAIEAVHKALDLGITYIDSSDDYGNGLSEQRIGKALQGGRRKGVFLATKVSKRGGDEARRLVERSLKNLQVDQIDLVHIHSLTTPEDLAAIEAQDGVLNALMKMKEQKMMRFIGITSHSDPDVLKTALERHDFDCTQMALNAAMVGMKNGKGSMVPNDAIKTSFQTVALPVANRKKMGVIAMKVYAQDALVKQAPLEKLLHYSLSLPVTTAVVGMPQLHMIEENVQMAKAFKPLPSSEMKRLSGVLSDRNKAALDRFFSNHIDG